MLAYCGSASRQLRVSARRYSALHVGTEADNRAPQDALLRTETPEVELACADRPLAAYALDVHKRQAQRWLQERGSGCCTACTACTVCTPRLVGGCCGTCTWSAACSDQQFFIVSAALRYGSSCLLLGAVRHSSLVEHGLSSTAPHAKTNHSGSLLEQTGKSLQHNAAPLSNTRSSTIGHRQAVTDHLTLMAIERVAT
jgi:hypothetical protein